MDRKLVSISVVQRVTTSNGAGGDNGVLSPHDQNGHGQKLESLAVMLGEKSETSAFEIETKEYSVMSTKSIVFRWTVCDLFCSPPPQLLDVHSVPRHTTTKSSWLVRFDGKFPWCITECHRWGVVSSGGYNRGECLSTAEVFDPRTNQWTFLAPMQSPRARFDIAVLDENVYAVCGYVDWHLTTRSCICFLIAQRIKAIHLSYHVPCIVQWSVCRSNDPCIVPCSMCCTMFHVLYSDPCVVRMICTNQCIYVECRNFRTGIWYCCFSSW